MTTPPTGPLPPVAPNALLNRADTAVSTWRVGQVLAATVVSSPQAGTAELRIGNLLVKAQTGELQLAAGQHLRLEVASLRELPVLRLLNLMQRDPVTQALRNALPRQQPLGPLLATLTRLSTDQSAIRQLAPEVVRLAQDVLNRLPDLARVTQSQGLRQAVRDSGLFLETKLSQSPPPAASETQRDLKANLIRLVQVLKNSAASSAPVSPRATVTAGTTAGGASSGATAGPLPPAPLAAALAVARSAPAVAPADAGAPLVRGQAPLPQAAAAITRAQLLALNSSELQRQAEGALARVQLNQLSSLPTDRAAGQEWLIELPVRRGTDIDVWSLRISRDDAGGRREHDRSGIPAWTVMLAFDLPGLGPMQTRVTLRGDEVGAQFFSQEKGVLPLIAEHLPVLHARLQAVGLAIADLTCHHGRITVPAPPPPPAPLLDEHA